MKNFKRIFCIFLISALSVTGCGNGAETNVSMPTESRTAVSVPETTSHEAVTATPTPAPTPTEDPRTAVQREAEALAESLGVAKEELCGEYALFLQYADCVLHNPKLVEHRKYALHLFPMVADQLSEENKEFFLRKVRDLKMETINQWELGGEFNAMGDLIQISDHIYGKDPELPYTVTLHELTHFVDAFIDGEEASDVYFTGERLVSREEELTEEEWANSPRTYETSFIMEGGAELFMSKYFAKHPSTYRNEHRFLTGFEWIFGSKALEELFFSKDSDMRFVGYLRDIGYSDSEIARVTDSFNYYTYRKGEVPENLARYEDVLIDLYEHARGTDWREDKGFCYILSLLYDGFYEGAELRHAELDDFAFGYEKNSEMKENVLREVEEGLDPDSFDDLGVIFLDQKAYLFTEPVADDVQDADGTADGNDTAVTNDAADGDDKAVTNDAADGDDTTGADAAEKTRALIAALSPTALLIEYDFESEKVLSHTFYSHPYPSPVPNPLPEGEELEARLASFVRDASALHEQSAFAGPSPKTDATFADSESDTDKRGQSTFVDSERETDERVQSTFTDSETDAEEYVQSAYANASPEMQALYQRAAELGNKYGVYIYLGDAIPEHIKVRGIVENLELFQHALDVVDSVLAKFPDGYFDQFVWGDYTGFEINLVGMPFYDDVTAFLTDDGYRLSFSLICQSMEGMAEQEERLADAIFGATDLRLKSYFENFAEPTFSEEIWKALLPEDFIYVGYQDSDYERSLYETYKDELVSFTAMRCAPKERSQLMAALMEGKPVSDKCLAKAEFYSRCIREAFDDSAWPTKTVWEAELKG